MLPQQLNNWRFRGSLRPSSDISYIDCLNSELNFKLSSYFEKPFKLNNSKKTPLNTTKLNQPHLCYSLPIVCSVFPSCFQASTHFHIEIPSIKVLFNKLRSAFHAFFLLLINYLDNVMTKFIVNNRTGALKTDVKLFFMITNCQIVRSCSLACRVNYNFMCLFAYWQWKLANERAWISAVNVKIYIASGPSGIEIQNLTAILILAVSVKIIIAERKIHFWYFMSINKAQSRSQRLFPVV